jgi:hypothetical protein
LEKSCTNIQRKHYIQHFFSKCFTNIFFEIIDEHFSKIFQHLFGKQIQHFAGQPPVAGGGASTGRITRAGRQKVAAERAGGSHVAVRHRPATSKLHPRSHAGPLRARPRRRMEAAAEMPRQRADSSWAADAARPA